MTLPNNVAASYTYDNDSRLTGISYQFGSNALGNLTYSYDQVGRRAQIGGSFARTSLPQPVVSASYDAANELTNWNGINLSYDANGNMLTNGSNSFTWNARNQVATLNNVSLQYDAFGRRIKNLAGTSFLYNGANAVQELSGSTVTANLLSGGVDEVFSRTDASGSFVQLRDAPGSTVALADANGNVQTSYTYDPFGNTSATGATNGNEFQYTGREDDGHGLYFYRARYYSALVGRFISEDPLGFAGSGPNVYAYAFNSPTNLVDPTGLRPGERYRSRRCAGWNAIRDINQTSKRRTAAWPNGQEYGGFMYQNPDGTYSYVAPVAGDASGVDPRNYLPAPDDAEVIGTYHTHGAYDPAYNAPWNPEPGTPGYDWQEDGNEIFSDSDMEVADWYGTNDLGVPDGASYLGTPQGTTEEYVPNGTPLDGTVNVLTKRNCGCR